MTKILIEIDTDTQRVVPIEPTEEMVCAAMDFEDAKPLSDWGRIMSITYEETYAAMVAAAPQPEPVDVGLRRDAERYRWAKINPDRAASIFDYLGASYFDSEFDKAMSQGEQK